MVDSARRLEELTKRQDLGHDHVQHPNTPKCNQLTWGAPYAKSGPKQTKLCGSGKFLEGSKASTTPAWEVQKNLKAHAL